MSLSKLFDWQIFCAKLLILSNLFDVNRKETISERCDSVDVFSIDFEQGYDFLVSNIQRLIQLGKGNSWTKKELTKTTHTVIFQSLPCRFWSSLLLKQRHKILLFCGSYELKITSGKNDLTIKAALLWSSRLDLTNDLHE